MYHRTLKKNMSLWQCYGRPRAASSRVRCACLGCHETTIRCKYYLDVPVEKHQSNTLHEAIAEHENLGTTLVTGLCHVADALPRVELATILYPTNLMKQLVAILYAQIMKFLVRALEWYEEGKIAHAIHSITKPVALRYDDIIKDIHRATQSVTDSAATCSQAEQRDMHNELRAIRSLADTAIVNSQAGQRDMHNELLALIKQLRECILQEQSVNAHARLEVRHALSDLQLTQALSILASGCSMDHKSSFQASLILRDKHRLTTNSKCTPFWRAPELQSWNTAQYSVLLFLQATFRD